MEFMKSSHLVCRFCQPASPSLSLQAVGMECPGYCYCVIVQWHSQAECDLKASGGQQRAHYSVRERQSSTPDSSATDPLISQGAQQKPYYHYRGCSVPSGGTVLRHKRNCTVLYTWLNSSSTGDHAIILPRLETRVKPLSYQDHVSSNTCNCFKSYMIHEYTWRYMYIDFSSYMVCDSQD